MLLSLLIIIPLLGILAITAALLYKKLIIIKKIVPLTSIINIIRIIFFIMFDFKNNKFQFVQENHRLSSSGFKGKKNYSFPRNLNKKYLEIVGAKGIYLLTKDGRKIVDASGGAAVSIVGHNNIRIKNAIIKQLNTGLTYYSPAIFTSSVVKRLCKLLIKSTDYKMARVILASTGSDAIEICIKVIIQFNHEKNDKTRCIFISLVPSYHGSLMGSLSLSGMRGRKNIYTK